MRNFRHLHLKVLLDLRSSPTGCQSSYLFPSKPWRPHQQHTSYRNGYSPKYAVGGDGGSRTRVRKTFSQSDIQLKLHNTIKLCCIQYFNKRKSCVISTSYFAFLSVLQEFFPPQRAQLAYDRNIAFENDRRIGILLCGFIQAVLPQ